MKKYIRYAILIVLLLAGLSVCATVVLEIGEWLFQIVFDNLFFLSFKVGFIASAILLGGTYLKRKKE